MLKLALAFHSVMTPGMALQSPSYDVILSSGFLCFSSHAGFAAALGGSNINVGAFVGTSSGALAAALLAAGFTAEDVARELSRQAPATLVRPALPWRGLMSTRKLEARMREVKAECDTAPAKPLTSARISNADIRLPALEKWHAKRTP